MSSSHHHSAFYYVKIWFVLLILLSINIIADLFNVFEITLITGLGIGVIKSLIVAAYFMHLRHEKRLVNYILIAMLLWVFLFAIYIAPDIMAGKGNNWELTPIEQVNEFQSQW